ncbi:MAG: sulfotransferase [Mesorhizobium sp.]
MRSAEKRGDPKMVAKRWRQLLDVSRDHAKPDWLTSAGDFHLKQKRFDAAEAAYRTLKENHPHRFAAWTGPAKVASARRYFRSSSLLWEEAYARFGNKLPWADRLAQANALVQIGDIDAAETICNEIESLAAHRIGFWLLKVAIAEKRQDDALVSQAWRQALERFPDDISWRPEYRAFASTNAEFGPSSWPSGLAENARVAAIDLRLLKHHRYYDLAMAKGRHYASRFADKPDILLSIADCFVRGAAYAEEVAALDEITSEAVTSFPNNRDVLVARARALLRLRKPEKLRSLLRKIEDQFGRCAHSDELRQWLAQQDGDEAIAHELSARIVNERQFRAIDASVDDLELISPGPAPVLTDSVIVLVHVKDDAPLLPWFFDYYRKIGADWFFVVDNDSRDGSAEIACGQPDATVYRSTASFDHTQGGARWINELMTRHGKDNWCIAVDVDEQLVIAGIEETGIRPILDDMRQRGDEVMGGFMLDMFPLDRRSALGFRSGDDPLSHSPHFDAEHGRQGHWEAPYRWEHGGVRLRIFGQLVEYLTKTPIVWGGSGVRYVNKHHVTAARVSRRTAALLHFKILRRMISMDDDGAASDIARLNNLSAQCYLRHNRYSDVLMHLKDDLPLVAGTSTTYANSLQLARLGVISPVGDEDPGKGLRVHVAAPWHLTLDHYAGKCVPPDAIAGVRLAQGALHRGEWRNGGQLWSLCCTSFRSQAKPSWLVAWRQTLLQYERSEEEKPVDERDPDWREWLAEQHGAMALEELQSERWPEALACWRDGHRLAGPALAADWQRRLANAMSRAGLQADALPILRNVVDGKEAGKDDREALRDALLAGEEYPAIVDEFVSGRLKGKFDYEDIALARRLGVHNAIAEGRIVFDRIKERIRQPKPFFGMRGLIPMLYDGERRLAEWRLYRDAADELGEHAQDAEKKQIFAASSLCARMALEEDEAFQDLAAEWSRHAESHPVHPSLQDLLLLWQRVYGPSAATDGGQHVFVIGLSKTGTTSLDNALSLMGFSSAHWLNPHTGDLLCERDARFFEALSDTTIAMRFRELHELYPKARFIYTKRPLESWKTSLMNHFQRENGQNSLDGLRERFGNKDLIRHGRPYHDMMWQLYLRFPSLDEAYLAHEEAVRSFFTGDRRSQLLEMDIFSGDGWKQLAAFVQRPEPNEPFPWSNKRPKARGVDVPQDDPIEPTDTSNQNSFSISALDLATVRLPEQSRILRTRPRPEEMRQDDYDESFDFRTVWYDAFLDRTRGKIVFIGPPLRNLEEVMKTASVTISDRSGKNAVDISGTVGGWSRQHHGMYSRYEFPAPDGATDRILRIQSNVIGDLTLPLGIDQHDFFEGQRVVSTKVKADRPEWIEQWLEFYHRCHGATAALIFVNDSPLYSAADLARRLAAHCPDVRIGTVQWNFPFGPGPGPARKHDSRFSQVGSLQTARLKFLAKARSILNVDIDELVVTRGQNSIFEMTENSRTGYLQFSGIYSSTESDFTNTSFESRRYTDSFFFVSQVKLSDKYTEALRPCPTKWCVVPAALPERATLGVHRVSDMTPDDASSHVLFRHVRHMNTGWKLVRNTPLPHLATDEELLAAYGKAGWLGGKAAELRRETPE